MSSIVIVRNLPAKFKSKQLNSLFSEIAPVESLDIVRHMNYENIQVSAVVTMDSDEGAAAIIEQLDGFEWNSKTLSVVSEAGETMHRKLFFNGISTFATRDEVHALFSETGEVEELTLLYEPDSGDFMGRGIVRMATYADASNAMKQLHGKPQSENDDEGKQKTLMVRIAEPSKPTQRLYLANLPTENTEDVVHKLLAPLGNIEELKVIYDVATGMSTGSVEVLMDHGEGALLAVERLHQTPYESKTLFVRLVGFSFATWKLRLHNLPPEITEQEVRNLFHKAGNVFGVKFYYDEDGEFDGRAILRMQNGQAFDKAYEMYDGFTVDGYELRVEKLLRQLIPPEWEALAQRYAEQLEETEITPTNKIREMIRLNGVDFMEKMLAETLAIEAEGGMLTNDFSRRRTVGGVFFYIAKRDMPQENRIIIFPPPSLRAKYKKKKKAKKPQQNQQQQQKAEKPKADAKPQAESKAAPKPQAVPEPAAPTIIAPSIPSEIVDVPSDVIAEFSALRQAEYEATLELEDMRTTPGKQAGMFSATKELWSIKNKIKGIVGDYPPLAPYQ